MAAAVTTDPIPTAAEAHVASETTECEEARNHRVLANCPHVRHKPVPHLRRQMQSLLLLNADDQRVEPLTAKTDG